MKLTLMTARKRSQLRVKILIKTVSVCGKNLERILKDETRSGNLTEAAVLQAYLNDEIDADPVAAKFSDLAEQTEGVDPLTQLQELVRFNQIQLFADGPGLRWPWASCYPGVDQAALRESLYAYLVEGKNRRLSDIVGALFLKDRA